MLLFRDTLQKSLKQLQKGEAFLEKISRILKTFTWKHVRYVCFPEVESKEAFIDVADAQDMKVSNCKSPKLQGVVS